MRQRPDLLDESAPEGVEVVQLTTEDAPSCHVYMEAQVFTPDSKRLVLHRSAHAHGSDKHDPAHRPQIGAGPVIKHNAGQAYASDARTAGMFADLCARAGVTPQYFVSRNDIGCGSTIGPISAARVGMPTVDVGNPMLSMHSCREMAGVADVAPMIDVLGLFLSEGGG